MAKKKPYRRRNRPKAYFRRKAKTKIPLLVTIPSIMPAIVALAEQKDRFMSDPVGAGLESLQSLSVRYTGYNPRDGVWYPSYLLQTYAAIIAGALGHKTMSKLGVNRALSKIPYVNL